MGEAKRRKKLDANYGKTFNLECFIAAAEFSDAHAVYLGIKRSRNSFEKRLISAHANINKAWEILGYCQNILSQSRFAPAQDNDEIIRKFCLDLISTYGDYPSDDATYELRNGKIEVINPPVTKTYKVIELGDYIFAIGKSPKEPFLISNDVVLFTSYVTAAYVADYINLNNLDKLTNDELKPLWSEANKLQGLIN
ncbi:hypothetical protein PL8927_60020 [Planktothrix serta PCC 8927]|uniref:Uncharacterized protein n=1 Tax=Planktothrix serta PCC 8927 TaxID=671068 RepID=A0A7Z9BQE0_9CYAN|nr:hypothetical protein [Planktothrix serta]VXD17415.1 hypothetical protein PL8927_60020 [Planktothrix serta PCC 8927]